MSYGTFKLIRFFIVVILGALVAWSAYQGNAWVPIPAVIAAIIILLLFRRGLKEIIIDERTYSVAYKASRLAFIIFGVGAVTVGATLLALGQSRQSRTQTDWIYAVLRGMRSGDCVQHRLCLP
jgi:uncharacterized membrane protein